MPGTVFSSLWIFITSSMQPCSVGTIVEAEKSRPKEKKFASGFTPISGKIQIQTGDTWPPGLCSQLTSVFQELSHP